MRAGRPWRKRRRSATERRSRYALPHQGIDQRPAIVRERSRLGDSEGDLIIGPTSRSAVATVVDRRSRYLRLVHLSEGHRSEQLVEALTGPMAGIDASKWLTLT